MLQLLIMVRVDLSVKLKNAIPVSSETVNVLGDNVKIIYLNKQDIGPFLGLAYNGNAYIQCELPESVQRAVVLHESYHLRCPTDDYWNGELRANLYTMQCDFYAWLSCLIYSIRPARIFLYARLFASKGKYSNSKVYIDKG